jgi:transaldolase
VRLTIKLPCHPDWLPCIKAVQQTGQAVLLTGVSNPVQLLWAQSLGVAYVAPYVGRLAADGRDVWALIDACVAVQAQGPALLAASIKSTDVLARLLASGAAAATLAPASLIAWSRDALTQTALAQFDRDAKTSQSLPQRGESPNG